MGTGTVWLPTFFKISLKLHRTKKVKKVETTRGFVNADRIFIYGWTIPLTLHQCKNEAFKDAFQVVYF